MKYIIQDNNIYTKHDFRYEIIAHIYMHTNRLIIYKYNSQYNKLNEIIMF